MNDRATELLVEINLTKQVIDWYRERSDEEWEAAIEGRLGQALLELERLEHALAIEIEGK